VRGVDAAARWLRSSAGAVTAACVGCLLFVGVVVVPTHEEQSPTRDEITHLTRGLAVLWTGDTRLSYAHPPLANVVAALPGALTGDAPAEITDSISWERVNVQHMTRAHAAADYPRVRAQWLAGRLAMLVFPLVLFAYLAVFVHRQFGPWAAVTTLGLLATHPTVLAHASLTTTDFPVATFMIIAACELAMYLGRPGWRPLARLTLAIGLAAVTKFSGILMVMVAPAGMLAFAAMGRGRFAGPVGARLRRLGVEAAVVVLGVVVCINAAYGFQRTGWTVGEAIDSSPSEAMGYIAIHSGLVALPRWLPVPLPDTYVFGVVAVRGQMEDRRKTWFLGKTTDDAGPRYYPMLLILKSPVSFLIAFAGGFLLVIGRRRGWAARELAVIAAVGGLFLAVAMASRLAIGVRHVLVCVPVMALVAGAGLELLARARGRRVAAIALVAAVVPGAYATGSTWPDFLGYFNVLAGGDEAERHISVAGEDWGQDVRALGRLVLANGWAPFYYKSIGHTSKRELMLVGVTPLPLDDCEVPATAGWAAVHDRLISSEPTCAHWGAVEPTAWLNNHVRIYRLPLAPR
jgi:hypothetical protein